ncbi:GGDEF domain-containing protein [Solidesulfovibrio sp.]|uniref:GGDEF domain-containing protein n=1 Tax=Solidesulfovibrio sp. TaxID=2910990 RepID=UPI00260C6817|nr:GGDEF domain-containing protein [Solidesulfovibrio sp.]
MEEHGRGGYALVAEADPWARDLLEGLLRPRCSRVVAADTYEAAARAAARQTPDVALVAADLPGGAAALVAALREPGRRVPVFLTGTAADIRRLLETVSLPGVRLAQRPFDPAALGEALDEALEAAGLKRRLEDAWELTHRLLDDMPQPAAIMQGARVLGINRAWLRFLGLASRQEFVARGLSLEQFLADPPPEEGLAAWACRLADDPLDREHRLRLTHPDRPGQPPHVFQVAVTRLPGPSRCLLTLADVTELELERRELLDLANLDPLTRALNRRKLAEVLAEEASRASRYGAPLSAVLLDIDHFKAINDTHGHDAGDAVLVELAARLRSRLRKVDRLARFGGEEFVVVAPGIDLEQAAELAERLRLAVAGEDFAAAGRVTASFGVARHLSGEAPEAMLSRADKALYRAKSGGRNRVEREASPPNAAI